MEKYNKGEFLGGGFVIPIADRTVSTEINQDFTLPDYQSEIKRLLRVEVTLPPVSRYFAPGGVEFSAPVFFDVLYAGGDGQLYTARLRYEYEFESPFEDTDADTADGVSALAEIVPDTIVGRVIAPRRLGIRAKLRARVRCFAGCNQGERIVGLNDSSSLRRLTNTGAYARILYGSEESIPLSDEIIPELRDGEIRVIGADGSVFVREAAAVEGGVSCRGDMSLKLMICREGGDGDPEIIVRKMPFTHVVAVDSVGSGFDCRAWGVCGEVNVTVGDGRILCEALMALEVEAMKAEGFEYTKDIYSTRQSGEVGFARRTLMVPQRSMNGNFTHSGVFDAKENNIPASAEVIDAKGTAGLGTITFEKGRGVLTGEVRYNILFRDEGEWGSRELVQPLRYEFDIPSSAPDGAAQLSVIGCRARMDGERVSVDAEIAAAIRILSAEGCDMVDEASFNAETATRRGEWVVFYPDSSDTLWGVSKRYHTDAERVAAQNAIKNVNSPNAKESLAGAKYIII